MNEIVEQNRNIIKSVPEMRFLLCVRNGIQNARAIYVTINGAHTINSIQTLHKRLVVSLYSYFLLIFFFRFFFFKKEKTRVFLLLSLYPFYCIHRLPSTHLALTPHYLSFVLLFNHELFSGKKIDVVQKFNRWHSTKEKVSILRFLQIPETKRKKKKKKKRKLVKETKFSTENR